MIRAFRTTEIEDVISIWLAASIAAHDFVAASYWESQADTMRTTYLPSSEIAVFERAGRVAGFYALHEDTLAALFFDPPCQGQGIGTALLTHAKGQRERLSLSVYRENGASCRFYRAQGFTVVSEQADVHTGHPEYTMVFAGA